MGKNQKEVMRHFIYWHTFVTGVEKTTKSKKKKFKIVIVISRKEKRKRNIKYVMLIIPFTVIAGKKNKQGRDICLKGSSVTSKWN